MRFSPTYAIRKFNHFNQLCFDGQLPPVNIEMCDSKSYLGQCTCKVRRKADGTKEKYDFRIRLSLRADLPEDELDDILIHEMIHYYIDVNHFHDSSAHGPLFRMKMASINANYGRHITISHKGTKEQKEQMQDKRPRWHVVAVLTMTNGKKGIKVLPRVLPSILKYYNGVISSPQVQAVELFMSDNVFFNRYPNSSSLRYHELDESVIESNLQGAEKMGCDGTRVFRNR
ncbi:MAG: SprT-like domain-containing protein [Bacteroidaceae bacterium]|nr:SprT-like domain-containing protein [Bacteroidaceae bacterium]